MKKNTEISYKERLKRIKDATVLKELDKVLLIVTVQAFQMTESIL